MRLAIFKLPIRCKFVSKTMLAAEQAALAKAQEEALPATV
jgi:hypothetical protein